MSRILIHLDGGIGNIIMATPAVKALADRGHAVDLLIDGDYEDTEELFSRWPAPRHVSDQASAFRDQSYDYYLASWLVSRPVAFLNGHRPIILHAHYCSLYGAISNEWEMYLHYARAIDPTVETPYETYCGTSGRSFPEISKETVVLAPGCKKIYPMKKWDKFDQLAEYFKDVAVVGTTEDLYIENSVAYPRWIRRHLGRYLEYEGRLKHMINNLSKHYNHPQNFGAHVKNYIGKLSLADTAALISQAGMFIGNDGGLAHVAAALGVRTYIIYGPTSPKKNLIPRGHVTVIQKDLDCQPCQFGGKYEEAWQPHYIGCPIGMKCLASLSVAEVLKVIARDHRPTSVPSVAEIRKVKGSNEG